MNAYYVQSRFLLNSYLEKTNWALESSLSFFFLQRLGRNKLQIGAAEREREQNKDTTESSGRITESRSRKTRHIFFSGKFEFSAGLRDSFAFVGGGLNLDITLV